MHSQYIFIYIDIYYQIDIYEVYTDNNFHAYTI